MPSLSAPMPERRRDRGGRLTVGLASPLALSWNNLRGDVDDCGVLVAACRISCLNKRLGDDERKVIFLAGGVLFGVVGRVGRGVSCLTGVDGFLVGVVEGRRVD